MSKDTRARLHPWFRIVFIAGITLIAIVVTFFVYQRLHPEAPVQKSHPLGDSHKLNYIGKKDYGCRLICDADPASTYYYETNMSAQDVAAYFKKATLYQPIEKDLSSTRIWLIRDNQDFILSYYENKEEAQQQGFDITANHFISLPSFNYEKAKNSL